MKFAVKIVLSTCNWSLGRFPIESAMCMVCSGCIGILYSITMYYSYTATLLRNVSLSDRIKDPFEIGGAGSLRSITWICLAKRRYFEDSYTRKSLRYRYCWLIIVMVAVTTQIRGGKYTSVFSENRKNAKPKLMIKLSRPLTFCVHQGLYR